MRIDEELLRIEIFRRGLNQRKVAALAGLSRVVVNNVCRGASCSDATAEKIAAALGVPVDRLTKNRKLSTIVDKQEVKE